MRIGIVAILAAVTACLTPAVAPAQSDCADWNSRGFFETAGAGEVRACLRAGADLHARDRGWLHPAALGCVLRPCRGGRGAARRRGRSSRAGRVWRHPAAPGCVGRPCRRHRGAGRRRGRSKRAGRAWLHPAARGCGQRPCRGGRGAARRRGRSSRAEREWPHPAALRLRITAVPTRSRRCSKAGPMPNARDKDGATPLHWADVMPRSIRGTDRGTGPMPKRRLKDAR